MLGLVLALMLLCITATAHAAVDPTVNSKPSQLSAGVALRHGAANSLRDPPVRANARRLRAPARAQAQPSTHGPYTSDLRLGSRRRARVWSTELGVFLQADQYGYLSRGGTLWSWPGNNPFRWRDPYGRYGWEDFGNDFYKHSEAAIDVSLSISVAAGTIATGGLLAEALGLGTLEAGLATVTAEAAGAGSALLARASAVATSSAAMVGRACSSKGDAARGAGAITKGEQVTEQVIREAMKDAPLASQQAGGVSLPRVQQYVDRLLAGEAAPGIKVDGRMIVDGNHRYIAGRIVGQEPAIIEWLGGRPGSAVPWADLPIKPEAW